MDEVFVISGIIKVEVSVISRSLWIRLITLTETLIVPDITKTETNNCSIIHKENKDKRIMLKRFDHPCHITRELDIALGNHALCAQPTEIIH